MVNSSVGKYVLAAPSRSHESPTTLPTPSPQKNRFRQLQGER